MRCKEYMMKTNDENYDFQYSRTNESGSFSYHQKKCLEMFESIISGRNVYIRVERSITETAYGEVRLEEISPEYMQYVNISVLTDEILGYDAEMFQIQDREMLFHTYRPYFISFLVPLDQNNPSTISDLGDGWFLAHFDGPAAESDDNRSYVELTGILETAASPVNYMDKRLFIFTDRSLPQSVLDKINTTYDPSLFVCTSSSDVETILNNAWANNFPNIIDIYNVGHGNADYIKGKNKRILYDIGYNYRTIPTYSSPKFPRATQALRQVNPCCVILSHWDLDHIIGCAYAEPKVFRVPWIAPFVSLTKSNAKKAKEKGAYPNKIRLANYLRQLGSLYLVDRKQTNKLIAVISCAKDAEIRLWLGSGYDKNITAENRRGLILEIVDKHSRKPHILLTGDVPYESMPDILNIPVDFMHVPHHCSNMILNRLKKIPGVGNCAVISTNRDKTGTINYNNCHYKELKRRFSEVINTIDTENPTHTKKVPISRTGRFRHLSDDELTLAIRIDYRHWEWGFR